jgi:hypothetical protein
MTPIQDLGGEDVADVDDRGSAGPSLEQKASDLWRESTGA